MTTPHEPGGDDQAPDESPAPEPSEPSAPPPLPRWAQQPSRTDPLSDERMAAYFGEAKWESVYRRKLAPFFEDASFVPTWNWSAALTALVLPSGWFLYRKLYLPFALFFLAPTIAFRVLTGSAIPTSVSELQKPENQWLMLMGLAIQVSIAIAAGGTANWFLFRRARAASHFSALQQLPAGEDVALLRRMGGTNRTATTLFLAFWFVLSLSQVAG